MTLTLTVVEGPNAGKRFEFDRHDTFIVGRATNAHFRLPPDDMYFSRNHFLIETNPPLCRLLDLNSRNGTFVNGKRVVKADLKDGDQIRGGKTIIAVALSALEEKADARATPFEPMATIVPRAASGPPSSHDSVSPPTLVPGKPIELSPRHMPTAKATPNVGVADAELPPASPGRRTADDRLKYLPSDYQDQIKRHAQPIPGYQLVKELGQGGMGVVYLAIKESDGSLAAVKTILPKVVPSERDVAKFLREAQILKALQHPKIVTFKDMGAAGGLFYFAMDYVPGLDAEKLIKIHAGPLPIGRAIRITRQLLTALEYAHLQGYVHRDVKPSNLLVTEREGRELVRLTDFGLSRAYESSRLSGMTLTGDAAGTPPFMAPEQITAFRDVKPPADQYSAAATLYYLLTKRFIHDFPPDVARAFIMILQGDPVPVRTRRPDVPDCLADVIHRGLARDPADRFTDVSELRNALGAFAGRAQG